jgi:signal recognition particle subunit SRP14
VQGSEHSRAEVSKFLPDTPILPDSKVTKSEISYSILIRITDGASDKSKRKKISTQVEPEQLSKFWKEYSSVFKAGATGLKKKEKSKKKKKKATK